MDDTVAQPGAARQAICGCNPFVSEGT
jgi:hypothetical protein